MASSGKQLNVRMNFQVDTTQAQQQLKGLYSQLNQITSAAGFGKNSQLGITQEIMQATKAAAQLKTAISEAINPLTGNLNLTKFNDQLRMSGMSLTQYREQLSALGTTGNQSFNQLARSIMMAETPMLRLGKSAQTMWTVLGNTLRWQATSSLLHGIMSTASQAMGYVKSLDTSLNHIRIVTGQSEEQMARFAKTANQAAKELNTSTNEYAKASLIYYQQGLSNKQVEERTRTTIKLANVAGQSAKTVSDQMTAVWNNFYNGSKSIEYYADVITALGASTASSSEEIAKGLQKFSSIAQTTGLSYEYATSALATVVAATRQSADSVGTSFKTLFSRLQGLSLGETLDDGTTLNKYSQALNTIGVNIKKANGDLKDMDTILNEIGQQWSHLNQDSKIALAQTVGGVRNYTGLMSLMDNWDKFQVNLQTAQQAQGTLQNQADIYAESWQAASAHVKAASETIYKNLLDDKFFKGLTNGFGSVLDVIGEMTNSLGGFKGSMLTLANGALQFFRPQITQGLENLGLNLRSLTPTGRQEVLNLRQEARDALNKDIQFSQYDVVNNLVKSYSSEFSKRTLAYEDAVNRGAISQYAQPGYQMLLNNVAAQEEAAIKATERMAETDRVTNDITIRQRQQANIDFRSQQKQLQQSFKSGLLGGVEGQYGYWKNREQSGTALEKMAAAAQLSRLEAQNPNLAMLYNLTTTPGAFQSQLNGYIQNYSQARLAENAMSDLTKVFSKPITGDNVRYAAQQVQLLAAGAKATGLNLETTIPNLGKLDAQITALGENATDADLLKLFGKGSIGEGLGRLIDRYQAGEISGKLSSVTQQENLSNFLQETLKLDGKDLADRVAEIVKNQELSTEQKYSALKEAGLSEIQQKQLYALISGEQTPATIGFAASLTTNLNLMASLGQTITAVSNASKVFNDENSTTVQQIGALGSVAMTAGMAIKPVTSFVQNFGKEVSFLGHNLGVTNGALGLTTLALTGIALAGRSIYKEWAATNKIENIVKGYSETIAIATQNTSDAKVAYEELLTAKDTHNNLLNNLYELQRGTLDFNQALLAANNNAQNLIDNYDLVYGQDYTYGRYGETIFDQTALNTKIEEKQQEYIDKQLDESNLKYIQGLERIYTENKEPAIINQELLTDSLGTRTLNSLIVGFNNQQRTSVNTPTDDFLEYIARTVGGKETQQYQTIIENLRTALPGNTDEELNNKLIQLSQIGNWKNAKGANGFSIEELAQVQEILYGENAPYLLQGKTYAQGILQNELSRNKDLSAADRDLMSLIAVSDFTQLQKLGQFAAQAGQAGWWEKTFTNHSAEDYYYALFGKHADKNLEPDQLAEIVETEIFRLAYTDSQRLDQVLKKVQGPNGTGLEAFGLSGLSTDISSIVAQYQNFNLPNIDNLTYNGIQSAFSALKERPRSHEDEIHQKNAAIQNYANYTKQLFENQIADLQEALLISFTDSATESAAIDVMDANSQAIRNAASQLWGEIIVDGVQIAGSGLTYNNLKSAVSAMTNANTIGIETGQTMYDMLINNRTLTSGFTTDVMAVMRQFNYDNSISGLYSNNQLSKYAQNQRQRDMYSSLLASQIKDMQEEKGFFMALYNSSGFADVMDQLNAQFQQTGQITAQSIVDLSSKSESLAQALSLGRENLEGLNINAGGLAKIFTELNRGSLSTSELNSSLISAMSTSASGSSQNAAAFEIVDNLNLGRSGTELLEFFQAPAIEFFNAKKAGWGFYTEPMQNLIKMYGGKSVQDAYSHIGFETDVTAKEAFDQLPEYFTNFMGAMAGVSGKGSKAKAKGGGGPEDVWAFVHDMFEAELGLDTDSDEFAAKYGFYTDANGNFWLDKDQNLTREQLEERLVKGMVEAGYDEEYARNFASVSYGTVATSTHTGPELDRRAAVAGLEGMAQNGTPQSEAALRAYYLANQSMLDQTYDSYDAYLQAYKDMGGNMGYAANRDQGWTITNTADLVAAAQAAGTTYQERYDVTGGKGAAYYQYRTSDVNSMQSLGAAYGAYDQKTGAWDYDKLIEMIESMGGTEADLIELMEKDRENFETVYGKDKYGRVIKLDDESIQGFVDKLNSATGSEIITERLSAYGGNQVAASYWTNPVTGEVEIDPTGEKEAQYRQQVSSAIDKKKTGAVGGEKGFSNLTTEEMQSVLADTATQLRAQGDNITASGKAWLEIYDNGIKDANGNVDAAATNKILTQILYNTDDVRDSTGEIASLTAENEEEITAARSKISNGTDAEYNPETGEWELPTETEEPVSSGPDWYQGPGGNNNQQTDEDKRKAATDAIKDALQNIEEGQTVSASYETEQGVSVTITETKEGAAASGQNNNILAFASGKEEGHIAVTGELGPELRIKEDGTAELLGKTGREYAWVEPGDKIYTATQTAGILGNNNIPQLEGLSRGIKNYIPGYATKGANDDWGNSNSGSGSGGGGGEEDEKDPRYDPNTLKIREILERYYTVLQQLDDISRNVEHLAKVADRSWGAERVSAIKEQTQALKDQLRAQERYVAEIKSYLTTDESALTTMVQDFVKGYNEGKGEDEQLQLTGAEFDENGVLTNYKEIVERLVEQYNSKAEDNAKDKEAQYKFQEQLKDIQYYTETLNTLEAEEEKLYNLRNQIFDNQIKEITAQIEYLNELDNVSLQLINYELNKVKDNAYRAADAIGLIGEKMDLDLSGLERVQNEGIFKILNTYSNFDNMKEVIAKDRLGIKDIAQEPEKAKSLADFMEEATNSQIGGSSGAPDFIEDMTNIVWSPESDNSLEIIKADQAMAQKEQEKLNKQIQKEQQKQINAEKDNIDLEQLFVEDPITFYKYWADINEGNMNFQDLTLNDAHTLEQYLTDSINYLQNYAEGYEQIIDYVGSTMKELSKTIDNEVDQLSFYTDLINGYKDIAELTSKEISGITDEFLASFNDALYKNSLTKLKGAKTVLEQYEKSYEEAQAVLDELIRQKENYSGDEEGLKQLEAQIDNMTGQVEIYKQKWEEASKDFQSNWKEALEASKAIFDETIKQLNKDFDRSFSPLFTSLEQLMAQFNIEKEIGDQYVDSYQRIHDLSKLNRDIEKSILDTDNLKSKQRLRDMQKQINKLQEDGTELSEYDLDILDKKYKLELARQALEDSKNNKSVVRLSRDNNGNWGYVYTSDEEDVDEAEQNYEDALRDMEEANENYIDNLQDQIAKAVQDSIGEVKSLEEQLNNGDITQEEYERQLNRILDNFKRRYQYLAKQLKEAFGNNADLDAYILDIFGINDHDLTGNWGDMILSKMFGNNINSPEDLENFIISQAQNLSQKTQQARTENAERQEAVYAEAGIDPTKISEELTSKVDEALDNQDKQLNKLTDEILPRIDKAITETLDAVKKATKDIGDIYTLLKPFESILKSLEEFLKESAKKEPAHRLDFGDAIDTEREIAQVEKAFEKYGALTVTDKDAEGNERLYELTDEATKNKYVAQWRDQIARENAYDVGEGIDITTRDEYNKINEYLESHESMYIKINGELVEIRKDRQEDMDQLASILKQIEEYEADQAKQSGGNSWYVDAPYGYVWYSDGNLYQLSDAANTNGGYSGVVANPSVSLDLKPHADTGGYTGRWQSFDTGGYIGNAIAKHKAQIENYKNRYQQISSIYTGEWPMGSVRNNGRLAWLHQKELVLNAHDTENFLDAMQIVRQLDNLTNWMSNGLGDLFNPEVAATAQTLDQQVHIDANFPNVTDHHEIEQAFDNLVNLASQYANRKTG